MQVAIARYIQANAYLFSKERRIQADQVAGKLRDLHRIFQTPPAPRAGEKFIIRSRS